MMLSIDAIFQLAVAVGVKFSRKKTRKPCFLTSQFATCETCLKIDTSAIVDKMTSTISSMPMHIELIDAKRS